MSDEKMNPDYTIPAVRRTLARQAVYRWVDEASNTCYPVTQISVEQLHKLADIISGELHSASLRAADECC